LTRGWFPAFSYDREEAPSAALEDKLQPRTRYLEHSTATHLGESSPQKAYSRNVAFCMSAGTGRDHNAVRFGHCGWWRRTWHDCGARGDVTTRLTPGFGFQETAMRTGSARLENAMWIDDTLKRSDTLKGRDGTIKSSEGQSKPMVIFIMKRLLMTLK
jgi:hypothetical protein